MKVKSESEVAQFCLTLSDPMDCSLPGSSVHGIFQARLLQWGAIAFSAKRPQTYIYEWVGPYSNKTFISEKGSEEPQTIWYKESFKDILYNMRNVANIL